MSDYIKREDAIKMAGNMAEAIPLPKTVVKEVFNRIPPVDVVEVVRCKDCKYMENRKTWLACTFWSADPYEQATIEKNNFCSYGERLEA